MKTATTLGAAVAIALLMNAESVNAAEVVVKWDDVKEFTDIEAVNGRQDRFAENVMKGLAQHVKVLGNKLPKSNRLELTFNDVDIAGRVEPSFGDSTRSYQRILDELGYPKLVITYRYSDANGNELSAGDSVELKELIDLHSMRSMMSSGRDNLYYEKELLNQWFKETFSN